MIVRATQRVLWSYGGLAYGSRRSPGRRGKNCRLRQKRLHNSAGSVDYP